MSHEVRNAKLRVYLETTIFNYYFDAERDGHADTVRMFEAIGRGEYEGYTSQYVIYELQNAPEPKRTNMLALIDTYGISIIREDDEVTRLADTYLQEGALPAKCSLDSVHIATATVKKLDYILSFNFQHINRLKTKRLTADINTREKYKSVIITTPKEVFDDEEADPC